MHESGVLGREVAENQRKQCVTVCVLRVQKAWDSCVWCVAAAGVGESDTWVSRVVLWGYAKRSAVARWV